MKAISITEPKMASDNGMQGGELDSEVITPEVDETTGDSDMSTDSGVAGDSDTVAADSDSSGSQEVQADDSSGGTDEQGDESDDTGDTTEGDSSEGESSGDGTL